MFQMMGVLIASAAIWSSVASIGPGDLAAPLSVDHWVQIDGLDPRNGFEPIGPMDNGSVYLIDFWATWCAPCVADMDKLSAFAEEHREKGLVVVAATEESLPHVVRFLRRGAGEKRTQFDRCRVNIASDPDRSTLLALVPEEFRQVRPFAVVVGRDGRIEWMGASAVEAKQATAAVLAGKWDRATFANQWRTQLEDQREEARILREEDWVAAEKRFWGNATVLARFTFANGFNFGGMLKKRDLNIAEQMGTRAVELTSEKDGYALTALAKVKAELGKSVEATALQQKAVELEGDGANAAFYRELLEACRKAAPG